MIVSNRELDRRTDRRLIAHWRVFQVQINEHQVNARDGHSVEIGVSPPRRPTRWSVEEIRIRDMGRVVLPAPEEELDVVIDAYGIVFAGISPSATERRGWRRRGWR